MKIILAGGTGHVGTLLQERWGGHELIVLTRNPASSEHLHWDGRTLGPWAKALEGADVLVNLAGKSVNCRYTPRNLDQMMRSRTESTEILGKAVGECLAPPPVWLNSSTATIYAHTYDRDNGESNGVLGGSEPDVPRYWDRSIEIAKAWEATFFACDTPKTRKVALRSAMIMSTVPGSVFTVLATLAKRGFLGPQGNGRQYLSWIHGDDFAAALDFFIRNESFEGIVNVCAPDPLPNREFNQILRKALKAPIGLPTPAPMLKFGALFMGTDTELLLKSRRVVPEKLLEAGFIFRFSRWQEAAQDLAKCLKNP